MGTIHSFGFKRLELVSADRMWPSGRASEVAIDRRIEYPIIFVQMDDIAIDDRTGIPISCRSDVEKLVPFCLEPASKKINSHGKKYIRYQYKVPYII